MDALQNSIMRPFGRFRPLDKNDQMPPAADCVSDSMVSLLSSCGDKWLKTRAVLTKRGSSFTGGGSSNCSLFLSKTTDPSLGLHRIPLHEINKIAIARMGHDEGGRTHEITKIARIGHADEGGRRKSLERRLIFTGVPPYISDSGTEDSEPDDTKRHSHAILTLYTVENGSNFGRTYTLRFKDDIMMKDWNKELQAQWTSAKGSYNRRTFISSRQRQIRAFYEGQYVQYLVAILIIANFLIEATSLQFNYEYDTEQAHILRQIDIIFTMVFLLELLVNMAANLVVRFFSSAWNVFDLCIVCISLLSLGSAEMDFVKGARILRVFRVLRAFGRIQSLRGLINSLADSVPPVMSAMFLCTCVAMIFAMFGVNMFGARSPEYFKTFMRAMYTLFQIATEGTAISRDIMETENLEYDVSIYFVLFVTIEVFILLPVVVAVLLESFTIARHRHREQEEKRRLLDSMSESMYVLDPLLESLMSHTSDQDLTSKLIFLFQKFDVDDDKIIYYQEFHEGLHKLSSFTPPIKLTLKEYEHIAGPHFVSKDCRGIDFRGFSSIVREQLKFCCQRQIGDMIGCVIHNNRQEALRLFALKMMIHEVEMFVAADGGGFGGQNWTTGAIFELNEDERKAIRDVTNKHKLIKIAKRLWNKRTALTFALWREAAGFLLEDGIPAGGLSYSEKRRLTQFGEKGESSRSCGERGGGAGLSEADRDDKVLAALQGIQATVDNLSERFSQFEKEHEAERQTGSSACQTSIRVDILSQRFSEYEKVREAERQQAQPGKQLPDACQAWTGNARAGDDREREVGSGRSGEEKGQAPAGSPPLQFPFKARAARRHISQRQSKTPPPSEQGVEAKAQEILSRLCQKPSNGSLDEKSQLWASMGNSPVSASVGAIDVAPVGQGTSSLIERMHAGHLLSGAEMRSSLHEAELGMEMMVDVMLEDSHYLDKCAERQRRVGSHSRSWHAGATNPTAVRFGNHVSEGGVIQENMAAGQGAEYFGNGEDRDSKVSLGPKRAPLDPKMVKVEPSDVGPVLPMMGSEGVGGITLNRWSGDSWGGWGGGMPRMHHDAEYGSSNPPPPPYVNSYRPKRELPQIGQGYLQLPRSQPASALEVARGAARGRRILLSHSQQLKQQGGKGAEAAGQPALEYCLRDIPGASITGSPKHVSYVPEGRGVGSGAAAEAGSNMVPEERLQTHPFANPSMSPPRPTTVDLAKQILRARSNRSETNSETNSPMTRSSIAW
jgi:voltage-gated sodium channel